MSAERTPSLAVEAATRIARLEAELARLRRENEVLRGAHSSSPVAFIDLDIDGVVLFATARALELLQVDEDTLIGGNLAQLFPSAQYAQLLEALREMQTSAVEERRCMLRREVGPDRPAVCLRAVLSRSPVPGQGYFLVLTDVTDIELRRQELAADVELMEALLEVAGVEFFEWQAGVDFRCSRGYAAMVGASAQTKLEQSIEAWAERVHPADRARMHQRWNSAENGRLPPVEYRVIGDDGKVRWLRSASIVRRGDDGSLISITGATRDVSAEHAARELLADRAAMTELIPDLLLQITADRRLVYINPVAERFFRESGMTQMPATLADIPLAGNQQRIESAMQLLIERGERVRFSLVPEMHPGRLALDVVAVPVFGDDATVDHALIAARDVSALVQAEADARKNLLRLQTLLDTARAAILMLDADGLVTLANAALCRAVGVDPEQIIGMPMDDFCFPEDLPQRRDAVRSLLATGAASFEWRMRTSSGGERWLNVDGSSFSEGGDKRLQFVFVGTDVDIARRQREALVERERWLDQVLSDAGIGAFRFDREARSGEIVGAYARLYRLATPRVLLPDELDALVPVDHRAAFKAKLGAFLLENGQTTIDYPVQLHDGSRHWLRAVLRNQGVREGHRGVLSSVLFDITDDYNRALEREELQRQVYQTQKTESLGVMAGGIAHDLNNMLMAALGQLNLALGQVPADAPLMQYLSTVESVLGRMEGLTERMLAYAGKSAARMEAFDVCALLDAMEPLLRASAGRHTRLRTEIVDRPLRLRGDITQIEQVVLNFAQNAVDAIGESGGQVLVRIVGVKQSEVRGQGLQWPLPRAAAYIELTVRDDGPGMDEATVRRIFEPFYTTKTTGRGLGLSVVQGIVKAHQGSIKILSKRGLGTEFRVYLPQVTEPEPEPSPPPETIDFSVPAQPARLLVIDDDEDVLAVTEVMLQQCGYEIAGYMNGEEAIVDFAKDPEGYTAAVVDLTMPVMDGVAVVRALRAIRPQLPVLFISGYSKQQAAELAAEDEHTRFLRKPFRVAQLRQTLEPLLVGGRG